MLTAFSAIRFDVAGAFFVAAVCLPLLPPVPVLILGVLVVLVSLAHLVTLWTGTPLKSRFLP